MSETHLAYLNLGSNIQPETNLPKAVELLSKHGEILKTSSVWESESVGTQGPNYLNVCILFRSRYTQNELKEQVTRRIEAQLGRQRTADKYSPRSMDIDIVLFDGSPARRDLWELAYVVVPLAEIYPEYRNPVSGEKVSDAANRLRQAVWLEMRRGVFD
ncbi:MAG TPA: 2-amino-4-hydroxy-6-hydroxymethyldihydropteridine diphosphokinase [Anaerolineales bacterium]|nr:2-amino-4-hydroxy-6-hydroxymethyldihydropteridine diphosphokinase [Anaerolineales bacterium]